MTLYAFDGTWNREDPVLIETTNVVRFRDRYDGHCEYLSGVGTRFGALGLALGGAFGAGGQTRIEEMYASLVANWKRGDQVIDIIGFSRGAALAVHFSNVIAQEGIRDGGELLARPDIRFLGLWDCVAAFGIPIDFVLNFQDINIGYDLKVPRNVQHCFHAMALHERRQSFDVERQNVSGRRRNVEELWFRGVHNDIGGGLGNTALSSITLQWMMQKAKACGLPVEDADIRALGRLADHRAPIGKNFDPIENPPRRIHRNDRFHPTALGKQLAIGDRLRFTVRAPELHSWSGARLVKGGYYAFTIGPRQTWLDNDIECGPEGWHSEDLPRTRESVVRFFEGRRRCPQANWFELIGAIDEDDATLFRIGRGGRDATYRAAKSGELFAFANDLPGFYGNNRGAIEVQVKRVAGPGGARLQPCRRR